MFDQVCQWEPLHEDMSSILGKIPSFDNVPEHISDSLKGICLLTAAGDSDNCVMNIDGAFKWV